MFLNIVPGTLDALLAEIRSFNGLETFPVISYPMNNMDGTKTKAELYPLADLAKKFGLYSPGLVNSLAIPIATDNLASPIDPSQLVRRIRYYRVKSNYRIHGYKLYLHILTQTVFNTIIVNTPNYS